MKRLNIGISYLIEKNVRPIAQEDLFDLVMDKEEFDNDHLQMVLFKRLEFADMLKSIKEFVSLFENRSKVFPVLLLIEDSDEKLQKLEQMREAFNVAVNNFCSYPQADPYMEYLEALVLLSLAYHTEYFQESVVINLLSACSERKTLF